MPRIVKEPSVRRSEIVDTALRLVYTRGYEQMTIQDILDDLQFSKGAFYHYFGSKQALLEAIIERLLLEAARILDPIIADPALPALEKFQRFFDAAVSWKTAQKSLLLSLLRVWYTDDNAIVRQKVNAASLEWINPKLTTIIRQGTREGTFNTPYPDQASEIAMSIMLGLGDVLARQLLQPRAEQTAAPPDYRATASAYTHALERVLGAPPGSLHLIDEKTLEAWMVPDPEGLYGQT